MPYVWRCQISYNGSGTFVINSAGQPVVTGTVITSTAFNALTSDLATGLTTALTKDGQTTPTANIPLGGYKITGLGAGTAAADAVRLSQLQNGGTTTYITAAGTNTITGTVTPALTAYATGQQFSFVVAATNTAAVTLNVDGVGAKDVTRTGSVALVAGDMVTGQVVIVEYDGTRFQLLNGNSFTDLKTSGTLGVTGAATLSSTLGVTGAATLSSTLGVTGVATLGTGAILGTPASATLTNATGLPLTTGVTGTLPVASGGTGDTTYTNGQLLIGNTTGNTLTKATLTAGTGVTITNSTGAITIAASGGITLGTVNTTTGGASINFTGIPANVNRITGMALVSTNGTSNLMVQLRDSGGLEATGYTGAVWDGGTVITAHNTGFQVMVNTTAASTYHIKFTLDLKDAATNTYEISGSASNGANNVQSVNFIGHKSLSGTLDGWSLTTVGGTDTFDVNTGTNYNYQ